MYLSTLHCRMSISSPLLTMAMFGIYFILIGMIGSTASDCYNCPHVTNPELCRDYIRCDNNEICRVTTRVTGNVTAHTMSCHDFAECTNITYTYLEKCMRDPSACNGFKRNVRATTCDICCSNDRCNNDCLATQHLIWRKYMEGNFDSSTLLYTNEPPMFGLSTPPTTPRTTISPLYCVKCENFPKTRDECNATELCTGGRCFMNFDPNLNIYRGGCVSDILFCPFDWSHAVGRRYTGCMECCDNSNFCNRNLC